MAAGRGLRRWLEAGLLACSQVDEVGRSGSAALQEGVVATLFAEGAFRAVARGEGHVVAQWQQLGLDRVDQVGVVALREVGAADAAGKQHIAHEGMAGAFVEEHHVAGRVAGAVQHLERVLADADLVAVVQPSCGREVFGLWEAEHLALLGQAVDPELVTGVWTDDRQVELARQRAGAARVVDVRVGEPKGLEDQAALFHGLEQLAQVTPRVDQGRLVRGVAPDERAVLFERGDGDGEALEHGARRNWITKF